MSCARFEHLDAAYVLGALSSAERREFEAHLDDCASCATSVRELAGIPGLLSRLAPEDLVDLEPPDRMPPELLPRVLAEVAAHRRRRRLWAVGGAVAASVVLVLGTVAVTGWVEGDTTETTAAGSSVEWTPMVRVDQDRLTADVGLEEVAWGTRISLRCRYLGTAESVADLPAYVLVLRSRDGGEERVATWRAIAGKVAVIDGSTATPATEITGVDVETVSGIPLLRLER